MTERSGCFKVWLRNDAAVEQELLANHPVETELTGYGDNDSVLDYLIASGLWAILTGMKADGLKCRNGYLPAVLNGVEVIRELAGIGRIQQCGKVLSDTRLMMQAGFNLACLRRPAAGKGPVIDTETLANHLSRISPESAQRTFVEYVREMRARRLIRGKVYAADAHEIVVRYGRRHERLGRVGAKYGFKLVLLINVQEERERIVGFAFAPLQTSERAMLEEILQRLHQEVAPLREWLQILLLDRGYWGARYLLGFHGKYGIGVVTRAQHEGLEVVDYIETALQDATWQETIEEHSRLGTIRVRAAQVKDVPLYDKKEKLLGRVNAVVADEFDETGKRLLGEDGKERPRFYYVTTLPLTKRAYRTRALYRRRWVIENQGFRELAQDWSINVLAGRRFAANYARIAFVLMLYS
ncbi:MAG: transposase, partial [candidate division WOR-3 bacterium]|nr:transposase [candidate division WOR-3 bacterium]